MAIVPHIRPQSDVDSALAPLPVRMRDADNAVLHGVAVKTIRRWRRLYQRRGHPRGQPHRDAVPRCDAGRPGLSGVLRTARLVPRRRLHLRWAACGLRPPRLQRPPLPATSASPSDLMRQVKPGLAAAHPPCARLRRHPPCRGSTGRACSPSTARDASTSAPSRSRTGRPRSSRRSPATSCAACSTPTGAGSTTGRRGWWPASGGATTTRGGSFRPQSELARNGLSEEIEEARAGRSAATSARAVSMSNC